MPRSKKTKGRPATAALFLFILAFSLHAASKKPKPYDMELEAYPAAPFPSLHKFGTVTLHLYPGGVRADSVWLNAFSRKHAKSVTVMNPVMRMYTEVPITEITSIVDEGSSSRPGRTATPPPIAGPAITGKVGALRAARYRLVYGPTAWIDIWTTAEIPENAQFRAVIDSLVAGLSAPTAKAARAIPGTPIYVELNFRRFKKVPLLKLKRLTWNNTGESDAMKVGSYYIKAPLLDAIWDDAGRPWHASLLLLSPPAARPRRFLPLPLPRPGAGKVSFG